MPLEHVVIVGNGPSASDYYSHFASIPDPKKIVRLNFFFLEDNAPYGSHVDYYFWAVNRERLHEELRHVVRERRYNIDKFMCPVPPESLNYKNGKVLSDPFWGAEGVEDHWATIANHNPKLTRFFMSRPLPTIGMQALAYFASIGHKNIHLFGMDFYQSAESRYAYTVPMDIAEELGAKHTTPGYESGAHSLDTDLNFLRGIMHEYPDLNIQYNGYFKKITEIIQDTQKSSKDQVITNASRALIADLTGNILDKSSFLDLERSLKNYEIRLEHLEKENVDLRNIISKSVDSFSKSNTALYKLFATEGLPQSDVIWVVHEMSSLAGVHRPLSAYLNYADMHRHARPKVINLSDPDRVTLRYTIDYIQSKPHRLILNSIACFEDARVLHMVARAQHKAIYLHETDWSITDFSKKNPAAYRNFLQFIKTATVFCVSEKQKRYVEEVLGAHKTVLVYNTVDTMLNSEQRRLRQSIGRAKRKNASLRIGMVGSYQPRKGSKLFEAVAKKVREFSPEISFEWVGKHHAGIVNTNVIKFHGPQPAEKTQDFIDELDVFFLSSFDDPQPLAALEALSRGVKLICFNGIGTAEWIKDVKGCKVFNEYTEDSALAALQEVVQESFDFETVDMLLTHKFDPKTFSEALYIAVESMLTPSEVTASKEHILRQHRDSQIRQEVRMFMDIDPENEWDKIYKKVEYLRKDPRNVMEFFNLARELRETNERQLADQVAHRAVALNSDKASAAREMALYLSEGGDLEIALSFAQRAIELNPASPAALRVLRMLESDGQASQ